MTRVCKAVLFDKDGVLVDFDATFGPATYRVLKRFAGARDDVFDALCRVTGYDPLARRFLPQSRLIGESASEFGPDWAALIGREANSVFFQEIDRTFDEEVGTLVTPVGDPVALLSELRRRGLKLGLVTNNSERNAHLHLKMLGLDALLDFVAGWDTGHGAKPDPGMIRAFAARERMDPRDIWVVGDSPADLLAARAAGAYAVGVASGPRDPDELRAHADLLLPNAAALLDILPRA